MKIYKNWKNDRLYSISVDNETTVELIDLISDEVVSVSPQYFEENFSEVPGDDHEPEGDEEGPEIETGEVE